MAKNKSTIARELIDGLTEIRDALRNGNHSKLTVRTFDVPDPTQYTAKKVKAVRTKLDVSQGLFAKIIGVSRKLVEHWESGVRVPSPMACRLLDVISRDPARFLLTVKAA